jgi:DNA-binding transcriptional ArsR family regulator
MPERALVARELGGLLSVLSHPDRIRIVEELRGEERDVSFLQHELGISQSGVSQHLAALRAHRLVVERREGRHVYYRLRQPALAAWLLEGLEFLEAERQALDEFHTAAERAKALWPGASGAR